MVLANILVGQYMPVMLTKKAQQSAETREAILSTCLGLFARLGFANTSIDEIAQGAGITKGAVYWHFDNKEALFEAILERIRERWQAGVLAPVSSEPDPRRQLDRLFDCYCQLFTEAPEICLFLQRVLLENDGKFSLQVAKVFEKTAQFISRILDAGRSEGQFRKDFDVRVMSRTIIASLAGSTQQCLADRSLTLRVLLAEVKRAVMALVVRT